MTSEDIRSELEHEPFRPFRLHLVSGKMVEVNFPSDAWLLQNAVMVFFGRKGPQAKTVDAYDVISLRNIERLESLPLKEEHAAN